MRIVLGLMVMLTTLVVATTAGCKTAPFDWVDQVPIEAANKDEPYRLRPGDQVQVAVWRQAEMTTTAVVRTDGKISMPLVGDVAVAGLTPTEASTAIQISLSGKVSAPVTVIVTSSQGARVAVLGEVRTPGSYEIARESTVLDAIARAGGLTTYACRDCIYVIRKGRERRIRFSFFKLSGVVGPGILFTLQDGDIVVVE